MDSSSDLDLDFDDLVDSVDRQETDSERERDSVTWNKCPHL